MTRSIVRMVLTTLALVLLFAGSFNLNRSGAQTGICPDLGCPSGPRFCALAITADGKQVICSKF